MINFLRSQVSRFSKDENGLALTEYLILLGLLTAGVIAAVLLMGTSLGTAWGTWGNWFTDNTVELSAPAATTTGGDGEVVE
jgi:pilus assembly protein Flp/PilA